MRTEAGDHALAGGSPGGAFPHSAGPQIDDVDARV
jgi:hypothetical protein